MTSPAASIFDFMVGPAMSPHELTIMRNEDGSKETSSVAGVTGVPPKPATAWMVRREAATTRTIATWFFLSVGLA